MVTLTAFRLRNISKPIASVTMPTRPWKFCIAVSWLVAILLGTVPYLTQNSQYFVNEILFRSIFNKKGIWRKSTLSEFACFYSALTNQTEITTQGTTWKTTQQILRNNFSESMPLTKFGYYGETSICMPRLFVQKDDAAWEYTLTLITLFSFCFYSCKLCNDVCQVDKNTKYAGPFQPIYSKTRINNAETNCQNYCYRFLLLDSNQHHVVHESQWGGFFQHRLSDQCCVCASN